MQDFPFFKTPKKAQVPKSIRKEASRPIQYSDKRTDDTRRRFQPKNGQINSSSSYNFISQTKQRNVRPNVAAKRSDRAMETALHFKRWIFTTDVGKPRWLFNRDLQKRTSYLCFRKYHACPWAHAGNDNEWIVLSICAWCGEERYFCETFARTSTRMLTGRDANFRKMLFFSQFAIFKINTFSKNSNFCDKIEMIKNQEFRESQNFCN